MNNEEILRLIEMFNHASREYFSTEVDDPDYKRNEGKYVMAGMILLEMNIYTRMDIDKNTKLMCKVYGRKYDIKE